MIKIIIKLYLKNKLSHKRYLHSLGVATTAKKIATICGLNKKKAYLAGLLHDIAREYSDFDLLAISKNYGHNVTLEEVAKPVFLHGLVGSILIKKNFFIKDKEILDAVINHTFGGENICDIAKAVYVADYIEPNRTFVTDVDREKIFFSKKIENMYNLVYDMSSKHFAQKNGGSVEKATVR